LFVVGISIGLTYITLALSWHIFPEKEREGRERARE